MPFNVVNKQGSHLGIILKKQNFDEDNIKIKDKDYYLVALTDIKVVDLCDINSIKKIWAKRCNILNSNGLYSDSNLQEYIMKQSIRFFDKHVSYEEALRLMHLKFEWDYSAKKIQQENINIKGYTIIKSQQSIVKDNKIIIDLPNQEPIKSKFGNSCIATIIEEPLISKYTKSTSSSLGIYHTEYVLKCGEVEMKLTLPYLIDKAVLGDNVHLIFKGLILNAVLIKGIYYELKKTSFNFFG